MVTMLISWDTELIIPQVDFGEDEPATQIFTQGSRGQRSVMKTAFQHRPPLYHGLYKRYGVPK